LNLARFGPISRSERFLEGIKREFAIDQTVKRPTAEDAASIEAALSLDRKRWSRRPGLSWAIIAGVVLVAALAAYLRSGQSSGGIIYETGLAERGNLTVEVSATGTLQPLTQVDISSELSGVVRSVSVNENQRVQKGDVLAELDTIRLVAQTERAEASVKVAEAKIVQARTSLDEAERTLARTQRLSQRGMVSDQALETAIATRDRARSSLATEEANLAIAQAELKLQQADLVKSRIYAPIDGIVLTRSVDPGQTVASSFQAPVLFVIAASLENMELKAAIDEADIGGVKPGQKARFTVDAFSDRQFEAEIRDIAYASVTTEGVVTYDARLDVDNSDLLLRPGMTATMSVVTRQAQDVLTVPSAAFRFRPVLQQQGGWSLRNLFMPRIRMGGQGQRSNTEPDGSRTLYVLRDGALAPVKVKTGATDGDKVEIVSGLEDGDQVITGASQARR
jgi:HlyD family secretion protein